MRARAFAFPVLLLVVTAGGAPAQQQPPEPTPEQMVSRLRYQWEALLVASVLNARPHGQSAAEYGTAIGHIFAPSWAKDLTPRGLARGQLNNIRLAGLQAELLEDTPERAVLRFSRPDSAQFHKRYGALGATLADYLESLKAVMQQIAAEHGLVWDQRRDGDWMVATVTRKRQ